MMTEIKRPVLEMGSLRTERCEQVLRTLGFKTEGNYLMKYVGDAHSIGIRLDTHAETITILVCASRPYNIIDSAVFSMSSEDPRYGDGFDRAMRFVAGYF